MAECRLKNIEEIILKYFKMENFKIIARSLESQWVDK